MTFRADDGGWKWINGSDKSDMYLTAYILFGLQLASQRGIDQDVVNIAETIASARSFLIQ